MHGNVWEWCEDIWHENYNGAPVDGSSWIKGKNLNKHVFRGGSWYFPSIDLNCASRNNADIPDWDGGGGFRICRM